MKKLLVLFIVVLAISCKSQECESLPESFASYSEATSKISNTNFNISDSVNTSASSWITEAHFYSCNGATGFLAISTSKKDYIFKNVPLDLWLNFKESSSFGKFYNSNIKDKFQLAI